MRLMMTLAIATRTPVGWWLEHGSPEAVQAAVDVLEQRAEHARKAGR